MKTYGKIEWDGNSATLTEDGWKTGDLSLDSQMNSVFPRLNTVAGNPLIAQFYSAADILREKRGAVVTEEPQAETSSTKQSRVY